MFDDPGRSSPERRLWQEVLCRVISDARLDSEGGKIPRRRQEEYTEARSYLTEPSEDLALVCEMAGVDMDALVERMRARIEQAAKREVIATTPRNTMPVDVSALRDTNPRAKQWKSNQSR